MQDSENDLDEETFVPLKDKRAMNSRKVGPLVLSLIILGTGLFFSILMILRSGGPFKVLFVVLSLALGYLIYEAIMKYKSLR